MKKKSISIFLPIRKNSKRLKNKNILSLKKYKLGLSEIKIKQLINLKKILENKGFDIEIIVSTDIKKIISYLKDNKNVKLHLRKQKLSTDNSLQLLINLVPNICKNTYILWTHVTSPLFSEREYLNFIKLFFKSNHKSAFSCSVINKFLLNHKMKWISHNYAKKKWPRTQDLKKIYELDSAALIADRKVYTLNKDRLDKKPYPIITKKYLGLDIDDLDDFEMFRKIRKL